MAELKITSYQIGTIDFNFDEIKNELMESVAHYETLAYSEENIRECKADHNKLKALIAALDNERKKRKKEYLAPLEAFEDKIKELQAIVGKPLAVIDKQLDAFEKVRKGKKQADVEKWWADDFVPNNEIPEIIQSITDIWDERWMNVTYSMKQIEKDVADRLAAIQADIDTINSLPEYSFEAMEIYKDGLDLRKALAEGKRLADIQARKEAAKITAEMVKGTQFAPDGTELNPGAKAESLPPETKKPENEPQSATESPKMWWVAFRAHLTAPQAHKLKAFFEAEGIEYEAVAEK